MTSDLRHHPAGEFLEHGGPALVDVAHWAAEWTWLPVVGRLRAAPMRWAIRWRPGSARCAPTRGPSASDSTDTQENSAESRPAAQLALLDVQELDSRADLLRHQRATLPELAEIAALQASRAELDGQRRDAQIAVDDLTAEQAKVDADVEQVKARRERDRDRMDQGLITNPKDLERMQDELESLRAPDHHARGRRARGDGAARGRPEGARLADRAGRRAPTSGSPTLGSARDAKTAELDAELAELAADRGPAGRRPARRPARALRPAPRAARAASARPRCGPASAAAAGSTLDAAELAAIRASRRATR